uniref:Uncharacterized protein n=1 Tax=Coturnix japonica TaxID=93934 RepID=A0A8C2SSJ3_COTJA
MMGEKKASVRVPEPSQRRVLDGAARQRRLCRQLEALERDNFGDDPQAGLPRPGKRLPNFADTAETVQEWGNEGVIGGVIGGYRGLWGRIGVIGGNGE